jgi:hypothetical protein
VRIVGIEPERATIELSMEELGLLMNALWQDLGYREPRRRPLDDELRAGYDALQDDLQAVIRRGGRRGRWPAGAVAVWLEPAE